MPTYFMGGEPDAIIGGGTTDTGAWVAPNRGGVTLGYTPFFDPVSKGSCRFLTGNNGGTYPMGRYAGTYYAWRDASNVDQLRITNSATGTDWMKLEWWNGAAWQTAADFYAAWTDDVAVVVNWKIHASDGYVTIFVNGVSVGGVSGINTSGMAPICRFANPSGGQQVGSVSEVLIHSESCYNSRVYHLPPTAQGDDAGGTGNYTAVDENTVGTADYIAFDTAGQKSGFTSAARPITLTPLGLTVVGAFLRTGETGPLNVRAFLKIGGTYYYGADQAVGLTNTYLKEFWALNPATGAAWTAAEINAATLQWGWEARP